MNIIDKYKLFSSFLTKKQKFNFYLISLLLIFQSILEVVGIGMVVPILSVTFEAENSQFLKYIKVATGGMIVDKNYLVSILMAIILIFFIGKSYFLYFCCKKMYNFCYDIQIFLKNKVFAHYIDMSYPDHLKTKSSTLISNISTNVPLITQYFTIPFLSLASDGLILFTILIALLLFEPYGFIFLSLSLISTGFVCYKLISKILKKIGEEKESLESKMIKIMQSSIGSFKVTKLHSLEEKYLKEFFSTNSFISIIQAKGYIFQNLPRFILELIGFIVICILIFYLILSNSTNTEIITTVGLFAAAGFKIIPSVNRIMISLQGLKYSDSVLKAISKIFDEFNKKKLNNFQKNNNNKLIFNKVIKFKNIFFKYPDKENFVLENFNLYFEKNSKIGIVGKSGSGKTTFLDILIGLLTPTEGGIYVDDEQVCLNNSTWRKNIAYVPQYNFLTDDTLEKNIAFGISENEIDHSRVDELLKLTFLQEELVDKNIDGKSMIVGERGINLSGGQIQRVGIARALYRNPKILIMDEPTSSLDTENEQQINKIVNNIKNITIVIVSHRKNSLDGCDKIFNFENGQCKELLLN